MWQLSPEQAAALAKLQRERDLKRLAQALGEAFPATQQRVGDRFDELVALGVQRGQAFGLAHLLALARYLACWFALGAEFETKPGFAWAQQILSRPGSSQGAKVYQLCRRTREALSGLSGQPAGAAAAASGESFGQSLAALDAALMTSGHLGSLFPGQTLRLGEACDIDAIDLRGADAVAANAYALVQGQWHRVPVKSAAESITFNAAMAGDAEGAWPTALHLIGAGDGGQHAALRLRLRAAHCCDPGVHPLVTLNTPQARREWRGTVTQDLRLDLLAGPPAAPPAKALLPLIAAEGPAVDHLLALSSCGLRDSGPGLGDLATRLAVYAGEQHLMVWRREACPPMVWPQDPAEPVAPAARVRIERDGVSLDASRWQRGLEDLDRQLLAGLRRLATAWERESGVTEARVQAEPRLLAGTAALTWGWAAGSQGMRSPPYYRVAGQTDLVACQLDLRLSGSLALQGSLSKLSLRCAAAESMTATWERSASSTDMLEALQFAQCSFRHAFVLALDVVAQPGAAVLGVVNPVAGALVGSCGLRPRADGAGLQWFARLALEPVSVLFHWQDPLLGEQELLRPLLPAMTLVDWSLG